MHAWSQKALFCCFVRTQAPCSPDCHASLPSPGLLTSACRQLISVSLAEMSVLASASGMSRACSLSRSGCLEFAISAPVVAPVARPTLQRSAVNRRSKSVRVRAEQQQPKGVVAGLRSSAARFMQVRDKWCSMTSQHRCSVLSYRSLK